MTAGELAARFSHYSWPTITRHLGVLAKAGLVTVHPDGRERHYVLDREHLAGALELWLPSVGLMASVGKAIPHSESPADKRHGPPATYRRSAAGDRAGRRGRLTDLPDKQTNHPAER